CGDCPPLKPKDDTAYKVPVLDGAPQKTEIVEIDGQKKVVRTEAWLGGSPVVHVSAMQDWMAESQNAKADATATERSPQGDVIDPHTQTGAVASMAEAALPETLNLDQFQLRMN
ncbi:MAG TPA: plant virulence effector HPE1-like domain-containing protein, partial [Pseudorhizobium sp.]|nr:plant virulence effector HPE1-like domain-containing protein [Pseudorhizobium sp.]